MKNVKLMCAGTGTDGGLTGGNNCKEDINPKEQKNNSNNK